MLGCLSAHKVVPVSKTIIIVVNVFILFFYFPRNSEIFIRLNSDKGNIF